MYLYGKGGLVTRLWAGRSGRPIPCKLGKFFYFYKTFRLVQRRTEPRLQQVPAVFCPMEKWLQHNKSDHSPPSAATINNNCINLLAPEFYI
jgi:hypothetical protein